MNLFNIASKTFEYKGQYYWADKSFVPFIGPETMIFKSDEKGHVTDWIECYCDRTDQSLDECIAEFKSQI